MSLYAALLFVVAETYAILSYCISADISKVMQAKKKRLEGLTKNYMKGSQQKLEQLWNHYHNQRSDFLLFRKKRETW